MNQVENQVIEFFSLYGISAEKIPESSEKTPDFLVKLAGCKILVELKTKIDSKELIEKREDAFKKGEMYEHTAVIARNNPISKRISTAYKQLKAQKKKI